MVRRDGSIPAHMPSIPEPRYVDDHDDRVSIRTLDQKWERDQLRCLLSLDDTVDEIYDHLATLRERANLLSFYLSDNGYMWGERGGLTRKRWPYGPSTRIPYLVNWPASGSFRPWRSRRLVANIDALPRSARLPASCNRRAWMEGPSSPVPVAGASCSSTGTKATSMRPLPGHCARTGLAVRGVVAR